MKTRIITAIFLALLICIPVSGQGKNKKKVVLTGKVINRDSIPVSNVTIFIDGQNSNIKTNDEGEFRLRFKPEVKKITFYSLFDGIFEIDYVGQTRIEVMMNHDPDALPADARTDADVVDAGYGKVPRDELVSSVSQIKEERFKDRAYTNVYDMIAGETTGVTVDGRTIRIRGVGSIRGSNDPLLLVDGSPVSSFDHISPYDVASIEVLKGSSAAIYGVRGANGVVIIKTKSGRKKKR